MLPTNLINALQTLSLSGKPAVAAATDTPKPVGNLEPGQQLQGTVQSKVSEGLFKVQVAGQTIQMRLPGNIQSGSTIKLEVITTQPRITFGMIASTNPLATPEQIGSTARLLSNLADQPLERPTIQQIARNTVWQASDQAPDSKQLASALRVALSNSGLFYESHQAQWVRGERSTAQLLVEPQNQLLGKQLIASNPAAPQSQAGGKPSLSSNLTELQNQAAGKQLASSSLNDTQNQAAAKPFVSHNTNRVTQLDELYSPAPLSAAHAKATGDTELHIARELLPLVQQQLHTLETHQLTWIGQVWPGQQMQWEIQGQPEHQPRQQDERQWSTEMELDLPNLGDVHARLVFTGNELKLTLHAADTETVDLFNRAMPNLKNSLDEAGILLVAAVVKKS